MAAQYFLTDGRMGFHHRPFFSIQLSWFQENNPLAETELEYSVSRDGRLTGRGETLRVKADQVLQAIGQALDGAPEGLAIEGGKIAVTGAGRTGLSGVWAGGDCASGGDDLTVTAVAEGRDAAEDIHSALMG